MDTMPDTYILGIESSCDETAAAVVRSGEQTHFQCRALADRHPPALWRRGAGTGVARASARDRARWFARLSPMPARPTIPSTRSPSRKVPDWRAPCWSGISYAKALAFALDKPLIAVNHLEGHIHAVLLEERQKGNHELQFPVLALVVSGGHTHLYLAEQKDDRWTYETSATPATMPPARPSTKSPSCSASDIPAAR